MRQHVKQSVRILTYIVQHFCCVPLKVNSKRERGWKTISEVDDYLSELRIDLIIQHAMPFSPLQIRSNKQLILCLMTRYLLSFPTYTKKIYLTG